MLHRVIYWIFSDFERIQDLPSRYSNGEKHIIRHKCQNRLCLNPDHYEAGTHSDNMSDKQRDGTHAMGEKSYRSTISLVTAQRIADSWTPRNSKDYLPKKLRAAKFKVSIGIVRKIDTRESWPEVKHPNQKIRSFVKTPSLVIIQQMSTADWDRILTKIRNMVKESDKDNQFVQSPCWVTSKEKRLSYQGRCKRAYAWACEYNVKRFQVDGETVRHLCGNGPICARPDHLVFGNVLEQAQDRRVHHTSGNKLTIETARSIRNDLRSAKEIAAEYSITVQTVYDIRNNKTWKE
jgi:hypothetical protein